MAQPIVHGVQETAGVELIQLNLLSEVGRSAARQYGVHIVPVTLVFDGRGELVARQTGMPERESLLAALSGLATPGPDRGNSRAQIVQYLHRRLPRSDVR